LYPRRRWWPAYAFGLSRARRIALQHEGQRADLPERWKQKAYVVPNIAFERDAMLPHSERQPTVAWIAALRLHKRPDRLIDIARRLPHVRFIVCGSPSTYMTPAGYSERAIEAFRTLPNIDYRGQVSPLDALRITAQASLLLSTSDEEGFPQTFLEAWSHGTPVVSLRIDPGGVIPKWSLGAVCGDEQGAAAAIDRFISDPGLRGRMGESARQYVSREHSPAAAVAAIERALLGPNVNRPIAAPSTV
jgi:glycosyltransferase involved in cell wall biosynthesis